MQEGVTFLRTQLERPQREVDGHIDGHPGLKEDQRLLQTVPGVRPQVSSQSLCVMKRDSFDCAEQLAAYLGMAAVADARYNPYVKTAYERLRQSGKVTQSALTVAMRNFVHLRAQTSRALSTNFSPARLTG